MDGKQKTVKGGISIHAPRAGRDCARYAGGLSDCEFQSTRPVRGATLAVELRTPSYDISIHAPRAGRDLSAPW